jgi:hypothetical protein
MKERHSFQIMCIHIHAEMLTLKMYSHLNLSLVKLLLSLMSLQTQSVASLLTDDPQRKKSITFSDQDQINLRFRKDLS